MSGASLCVGREGGLPGPWARQLQLLLLLLLVHCQGRLQDFLAV